jgi:hypothetical protein
VLDPDGAAPAAGPDPDQTADPAADPVADLTARHDRGEPFRVAELILDQDCAGRFVQFRSNPPRFTPKIFDGDWALVNVHPAPGPIRIVRVITGLDGVSRAIGRQGAQIYASPWIG